MPSDLPITYHPTGYVPAPTSTALNVTHEGASIVVDLNGAPADELRGYVTGWIASAITDGIDELLSAATLGLPGGPAMTAELRGQLQGLQALIAAQY